MAGLTSERGDAFGGALGRMRNNITPIRDFKIMSTG